MTQTDSWKPNLIVVRVGELFLKGANRGRFEHMLRDQLLRALAPIPGIQIQRGQGRFFLDCPCDAVPQAMQRLSYVFGMTSFSPARRVTDPTLEHLSQVAVAFAEEALRRRPRRTFRVTCRRSNKRFPFSSVEVGREVGAQVNIATQLKVNLTEFDLDVGVEIGDELAFVFVDRIPGPGGLPMGSAGRIALLLSGGIDSPVAGHLMQKRGCVVQAIYFHSFPYTGERAKDKVRKLAARLARYQGPLELCTVPFTDVQLAIRDACPSELYVIMYRRMMMRIASAIAKADRAAALATGESLGQVASQTLSNLATIEAAASLPVLRPLIAFDKAETIAIARRIETYETSIEPYDDCCSLFVPRHPATKTQAHFVERSEAALDIDALVQAAVAGVERIAISEESI